MTDDDDPNDIPPTSSPPSPSIASKRRFSQSAIEDPNDYDSAGMKSLHRFSSSSSTPSTSSKRGRMTGTIALTTIGHGILEMGASYCKSLDSKDIRHQDRMTQWDRQLGIQRERQERQDLQESLERKEREERQQKHQDAIDCAQEIDLDLESEDLAKLLEVFQHDIDSAVLYLSIKTEGVRKAWVKRRIAERPSL